jgi:hypothetical protein
MELVSTFSLGRVAPFSLLSTPFWGALPSNNNHTGRAAVMMLIAQKALMKWI